MLEDLRRSTNAEGYVGTVGSRKRRRRNRGGSKKALLVSSVLALLLLGGGTAVASLGYLDTTLPWRAQQALMTAAQPVVEDAPEAPEAEDSSQASSEPEQTTASETPPAEETLASVPNVNTYFDYFAVDTLRNSGFQTKVVYQYHEGYLPSGVTWGTDPAVGTLAPLGSTITVYATPKDQPQIVQAQPQIVQAGIQPQTPI
jgi:hypothetical protein